MARSLARHVAAALALAAAASAQVDVAWSDGFAPPSQHRRIVFDVDTDADGGAVVAHGSLSSTSLHLWEELVLRRLDENGQRSWTFSLPLTVQNYGAFNAREVYDRMVVDDDGSVAFAVGAADAVRVRVLEPDAVVRWTRAIPPTVAPQAWVVSLEFLDDGDVIAVVNETPNADPLGSQRIAVVRLDGATGATVWRVDTNGINAPRVASNALGETAILTVWIGGYVVERYDALGGLVARTVFTIPLGSWEGQSLHLDDSGRVVAVHRPRHIGGRSAISSIDPSGVVEWTTIDPHFGPGDLLAGGDYVYSPDWNDEPLRRIRRDGTAVGSAPVPLPNARFDRVHALPDGGFLAAGLVGSVLARGGYAWRYDVSEQLVWELDLTPSAYRWADLDGFALDARGNPILATTLRGQSAEYERGRTIKLVEGGDPGVPYCSPAVSNSTGAPAVLRAAGSDVVAVDNLTLLVDDLPPGAATLALASRVTGFVPNAGGSQGTLCLGGSIGRYVGPGQVQSADAAGHASLQLDLGTMPTPTGLVPAVVGETWSFQAWYRDANPALTSNFTSATSVTMR